MDMLANIRAFVAVAEAGSFSAAARRAGVAPSVMTKRVDQLEWRIRAALFVRSTRRLTLTDVGERYLATLRTLTQQIDDTLAGMAQASGALEGPIRVKVPTTLGLLHLNPLLNAFLQEQPRISLDVVLADRSVNPAEEGFDLAIGARPESYGQVQDHPLVPIRRWLCAAPGYLAQHEAPRTPTDLLAHAALVLATTGPRWELQGPQGLVGVEVRARLKSNDGLALRQAARDGLGIALLADYLVAEDLASGRLLPVLPAWQAPAIWLKALVPTNRAGVPRIQALLHWLQQGLRRRPPWVGTAPAAAATD
jgi:DNA-binding transcriptional LysR family regulator